MVSSAIASRALTPAGRHRFALATKMLLWSHFVEPQPSVSSSPILQTKNPRPVGEGFMFGRTRRIRTADLYHVKVAL